MTEHRDIKVAVLLAIAAVAWTPIAVFAGGIMGVPWVYSFCFYAVPGWVLCAVAWRLRYRESPDKRLVEEGVKMEATPVTASGLVYLCGEEFVKPRGVVGGPLKRGCLPLLDFALQATFGPRFGASNLHRVSEERLAYSGQEVDREDLVIRLFEAAFVSLGQEGYISLATEKEEVTIAQERVGDDLPPSLERAIVEALSADPEEDSVPLVVARLAGPLRTDRPWRVLKFVKRQLVEEGYLGRRVNKRRFLPDEVHWWAHEEAIEPLAGEVEALKTSLEAFASVNQDLHTTLVGAITDGLLMAG